MSYKVYKSKTLKEMVLKDYEIKYDKKYRKQGTKKRNEIPFY